MDNADRLRRLGVRELSIDNSIPLSSCKRITIGRTSFVSVRCGSGTIIDAIAALAKDGVLHVECQSGLRILLLDPEGRKDVLLPIGVVPLAQTPECLRYICPSDPALRAACLRPEFGSSRGQWVAAADGALLGVKDGWVCSKCPEWWSASCSSSMVRQVEQFRATLRQPSAQLILGSWDSLCAIWDKLKKPRDLAKKPQQAYVRDIVDAFSRAEVRVCMFVAD